MWIMKDELLDHLQDDHLLVPIGLVHLLHEYDLIYESFAFFWILH